MPRENRRVRNARGGNLRFRARHTDNHHVEVEPFSYRLPVPLVRQVGETDVASELSPNDVLRICGSGGGSLGGGLGVR